MKRKFFQFVKLSHDHSTFDLFIRLFSPKFEKFEKISSKEHFKLILMSRYRVFFKKHQSASMDSTCHAYKRLISTSLWEPGMLMAVFFRYSSFDAINVKIQSILKYKWTLECNKQDSFLKVMYVIHVWLRSTYFTETCKNTKIYKMKIWYLVKKTKNFLECVTPWIKFWNLFPGIGQNAAASRLRGHVLGDWQGVVSEGRGSAVATPRAGHQGQTRHPRRQQDRPRQI